MSYYAEWIQCLIQRRAAMTNPQAIAHATYQLRRFAWLLFND